jgi:hypothetical protein
MSVEIHQPEIEALIRQRMASGAFDDVEHMLLHALKSAPQPEALPHEAGLGKRLVEVCAMGREPSDDVEFSRDLSSAWRPLDFL